MAFAMFPHFANECVRQPFSWSNPVTGLFALLVLWSLAWKAVALWKAARNHHIWWYVALLVINTLGLLEILYIFVFSTWGKKPASGTLSGATQSPIQ